jgi:hypothetical protein
MFSYIKKRARKIDLSLLTYIGAFGAGVTGENVQSYKGGCPKLLRAFRDGARMRKKSLDSK